ncbi:DUF6675 family protein [Sphaerochaeta sp.]|jgi:hypothetical protein|uniref:DUF6675 family protein n=1 Tax=Sphaerochaeta sp. TaxID=1972642 RepID=UPI003D112974
MNRKYLVVSLGFLIASSLLWATPQDLFSLSQTEWMNLLNGQNLTRSVIWDNSVAELAPSGSIAQEKTKEAEARAKGISVASLALVPYPKNWETQSEEQRKLELYNLLHRVSTLQGLTYGDEKKKVLFSESYTIKNPEDKKSKVEDPVAQALPSIDITYVCQEDSIFGKNIYQHTYQVSQDEVFVDITNLTTMKFLGISFVKPKDMSLYLSATKTQEGILLYASTTLATTEPKVSFLFWSFNLADESMNRIIAYQDWFRTQV